MLDLVRCMQYHVHIQNPPDPKELEYLKQHLDPSIRLTTGEVIPDPEDYRILIAGRPKRALLEASESLEALIIPWAGIPPSTKELLKEYPHFGVHNLHYNAISTAEFAMALLLAAAKKLVPIDRSFREHDWTNRYLPNPSILLKGKQALILGYGEIGHRVGKMCLSFGMKVSAVRRSIDVRLTEGAVELYPMKEMMKVLANASILFVCLPETSDTIGLIGKDELDRLPKGAILVNIARGAIVQEKALYNALSTGKLAAAGLDVWYQYPENEEARSHTPPSAYPFHELDNVVMSPHRAGGWTESDLGRMEHLARLLNQAAAGERMQNELNLDRGY